MDERDAIARMKRGDIDGLGVLVERYQLRALRAAVLITRDRALAEDVVQSAFIRSFHKINQFDASKSFGPWFLRSVVNAAIQVSSKQQRILSLDNGAGGDETFASMLPDNNKNEPQVVLELSEQKARIEEALDQLTPDQRAIVVMRYFLDMSEQELTDTLDIPAGTVKWRLHSARNRLRGLLGYEMAPANEREV